MWSARRRLPGGKAESGGEGGGGDEKSCRCAPASVLRAQAASDGGLRGAVAAVDGAASSNGGAVSFDGHMERHDSASEQLSPAARLRPAAFSETDNCFSCTHEATINIRTGQRGNLKIDIIVYILQAAINLNTWRRKFEWKLGPPGPSFHSDFPVFATR